MLYCTTTNDVHTTHYTLHYTATHYTLHSAHNTPHTTLHCYTLHTSQCTQHTTHYITLPHTTHCTLHTTHYTLHYTATYHTVDTLHCNTLQSITFIAHLPVWVMSLVEQWGHSALHKLTSIHSPPEWKPASEERGLVGMKAHCSHVNPHIRC